MDDWRRAFTLVEMLVVIGITTMLAALSIGYSHIGANENALTIDTAKMSELMLQARQLAIATYSGTDNACAYGVSFDYTNQTYSLFGYVPVPANGRCPGLASTTKMGLVGPQGQQYEQKFGTASWKTPPSTGVTLLAPSKAGKAKGCSPGDIVYAVMFFPPDPQLLVSYDGTHFTAFHPSSDANVCLATTDGQNSSVIKISPVGQITF